MTTTDAPAGLAAPGADGLLQRIEDLHDLIAKNAAQGEADRRVPQDTVDALMAAGAFKVAVPRRYGGYETSMRTMLDVSAAVAEADGGTSWIVTLLNVCAWLTGLFPERAQDEVFGDDPNALVSGVLAPTTRRWCRSSRSSWSARNWAWAGRPWSWSGRRRPGSRSPTPPSRPRPTRSPSSCRSPRPRC